MGNKSGCPLSDDEMEEIQYIVKDVIESYTKEFSIRYKDLVVAGVVKAQKGSENEEELKLPPCTVPEYAVKTGLMLKKGAVNKGWKLRYFYAHNYKQNWAIDYYEDEMMSKHKGTIQCCGYTAEEFSGEEEEMLGKFGIKLVPDNDKRRTWFLRCDNEEEKSHWTRVFMNACLKATPPVHSNQSVVEAFHAAFRSLRRQYGYSGWYNMSYTECEHLSRLCKDMIMKNCPQSMYRGTSDDSQILNTQKYIDTFVTTAASKAWSTSMAFSHSKVLEDEAQKYSRLLMDEERKLTEDIVSMTSSTVDPFLRRMRSRVSLPILRSCTDPVTNAFVTSIHGFRDYMIEQIREGAFERCKLEENIVASHRAVEEWWSGPLEDTNQICWEMYMNDLSEISSFFVNGFSSYNLYSDVLDANRTLIHRALSRFLSLASASEESSGNDLEVILKNVLFLLTNDAKALLKSVLQNILNGFLQPSYEVDVVLPCIELVQPLQSKLDATPEVANILTLSSLCERVVHGMLKEEVAAVVETKHAECCLKIDASINAVAVLPK